VNTSLGNYPGASVTVGGNINVTPNTPPTNTSVLTATASTGFTGILTANPTTGIVQITNASPAGTYTITVSIGTCISRTFTLTVGAASCITQLINATPVLCFGGSSTITVSALGGTQPYTGTGTFIRPAGTHTFTVTDASGCVATNSITISQPNPIIAASGSVPILCNGSTTQVTVSASGGVPPYSGTGVFTVGPGPYSYTVTDINGCTSLTNGIIAQPTPLLANSTTGSILCNGGTTSVTVTGSGGTAPYTGTGTFNVNAGTYNYTITDNAGCTASTSGTITQPGVLTANSNAGTIACNGSSTTVTVTGNGGTQPYSGIGSFTRGAGPYTYTVTDANGCAATTAGVIPQPSAFTASSSAGSISCFGGSTLVNVFATGGTPPYSGTGSFTKGAGSYSYTVTDAAGCIATTTGSIVQPAVLNVASGFTPISCNGGSTNVTVSASGGTPPYFGTGTFTSFAGSYSYTVADANGCVANTSGSISQPTIIAATASAPPIACNGGSTSVTISASGGTPPYSGTGIYTIGPGIYSYTVTDNNGCSTSVSGSVFQPTPLAVSSTAGNILCNGGTALVNVFASGGTPPYSGTGNLPTTAGPYAYTVTDANGCSGVASGNMTQPGVLTATVNPGIIACFGGTANITVNASGGTPPYSGTGAYQAIAGNYNYTVTDANGCSSSASGLLNQPQALIASSTAGTIACNGTAPVTVNAIGGTPPYLGIGNFSLGAGQYTLTVTDANGCTSSTSGNINPSTFINASITSQINPTCFGAMNGSVTIIASGGNPPYSGTGTINNLSAGSNSFIVSDANGCLTTVTTILNQPDSLSASISLLTNPTCFGNTNGTVQISANGGTPPYAGTGTISALGAGTYNYQVTDANGCSTSVVAQITNPPAIQIDSIYPNPAVPGTLLTIKGTGLALTDTIHFNGAFSDSIIVISDSLIRVVLPNNVSSGIISLVNTNGCEVNSLDTLKIQQTCALQLNMFIEGLYLGNNRMTPALFNSGVSTDTTDADIILVTLVHPTSGNTIATSSGTLKTNGILNLTFPGQYLNNSYYVVVKHRNSIGTWSKQPVLLQQQTFYDFSD
jgi:hypothetical protein